jgi:hypothetical protein
VREWLHGVLDLEPGGGELPIRKKAKANVCKFNKLGSD